MEKNTLMSSKPLNRFKANNRMQLSELPLEGIELRRNGSFSLLTLCDFQTDADALTFIEHEKYIPIIKKNPNIKCIICTNELFDKIPKSVEGVCVSHSPKTDFFFLHNYLCHMEEYNRLEFETQIGNNCSISPLAYVDTKNVIIGNNVNIEEFASIKANTQIGDNVTICSGAIVGSNGFEFKKTNDSIVYIEHAGGVRIGNNVDIYCNACVCKAIFPWDDTVIDDDTKIDNLVHIAHACKIGKRNIITACVIICGSALIEDDVYVGPNATIAKINMLEKSKASLGSVVTKNVESGSTVSGNFAVDHFKFLQHIKGIAKG